MDAPYGQECIVDVHDSRQFDRGSIKQFCEELCCLIGMDREELFFWDYDGDPEGYKAAPAHLKGRSAVQFIKTSNITIHVLDELERFYLNVFSCKPFDAAKVAQFVRERTGGKVVSVTTVMRW